MVCSLVGTAPRIGSLNASGQRMICLPPTEETPRAFMPLGVWQILVL